MSRARKRPYARSVSSTGCSVSTGDANYATSSAASNTGRADATATLSYATASSCAGGRMPARSSTKAGADGLPATADANVGGDRAYSRAGRASSPIE